MDEHLIITPQGDGMVKIMPEVGYKLLCVLNDRFYSEAVVLESEVRNFKAVQVD